MTQVMAWYGQARWVDVSLNATRSCRSFSWWWRHNERDGISNHQHLGCLLNSLCRRRSKKTSKLRLTGLCDGNPPMTGGFPHKWPVTRKMVSIWWRHHARDRVDHLPLCSLQDYIHANMYRKWIICVKENLLITITTDFRFKWYKFVFCLELYA